MSAQRTCPSCTAPLEEGVGFCVECGTKVDAPPKSAAAKHTMLGLSPEQLAALTRAAAATKAGPALPREPIPDAGRSTDTGISEPPRGQMGRTVLGMTPPPAATVAAALAQATDKRSTVAGGASAGKPMAKTMFGLGLSGGPTPGAQPPGARAAATNPMPASAAAPAGGRPAQKTMFAGGAGGPAGATARLGGGRSTPMGGLPLAAPSAEPEPSAELESSSDLERTRFGAAETPVAEPSDAPLAPRSSRASHTLMGLEDDAPEVDSHASQSAPLARTGASASVWDQADDALDSPREPYVKAESTLPPVRTGIAPGKLLLVAVLLLAAIGLAVLATMRGGPEVRVHVASEAGHDTLQFEVPGAVAGAKLRFGGQEHALAAGRASFALGADAIRVGENVVLYDLVEPGGAVESGKITLSVDYRVTIDTAPLRAGKAAVDVVVAARPGSQVWLDGQPLALDAQGRAVRSDPLELTASSSELEHVVRYRVQPPAAEATVGELRTLLSVTRLAIDRPGDVLVTDRDVVEIAGEVEPGAIVSIDGRPVEVLQGRFLHRLSLPAPGEHKPVIVAMAEGKAPRTLVLHLTRVTDLALAAKAFKPDATISYVKLAQNADIYRGQQVELEGRVYNVSVQSGQSALQVLVRACPAGKRCPLWVSYPAATDFTVDSWVRVLGTVEGEQAFVSETGEQKRVPKVQAAFLLPAKP
jgi:hypothetical protein